MADQNLDIHIRALDETHGAIAQLNTSVTNIGEGFQHAGTSMRMMGREIGQIGIGMMTLGTAITAPLVLAYANAGKYSADIARQQEQMKNQWDDISVSIGQSMLPVMQQLLDTVTNAVRAWESLSKVQRDHLIQTSLVAGEYLLMGGIAVKSLGEVFRVTGDVLKLMGGMIQNIGGIIGGLIWMASAQVTVQGGFIAIGTAAQIAAGSAALISIPLLIAVGVVVTIVAAMFKWKEVGDQVFNGFQKIIDVVIMVGAGIDQIIAKATQGWAQMFQLSLDGWSKILGYIPVVGSAWAKAAQTASDGMKIAADVAGQAYENSAKKAADAYKDLMSFDPNKNGSLAVGFDAWKLSLNNAATSSVNFGVMAKDAFTKAYDAFKVFSGAVNGAGGTGGSGGGGGTSTNFWSGFNIGIEETQKKMANMFTLGSTMAASFYQDMKGSLDTFFNDVFTGQINNAQKLFTNFGNALIKTFSNAIAQMAANWLMFGSMFGSSNNITGGIFGAIGSIAGAFAGAGGAISSNVAPFTAPNATQMAGMHFHSGGMIQKAHDGLGVDEVPIIAQSGEGVLSRNGMSNLAKLNAGQGGGGGGVTINITPIIQAWDAQDVLRNMTTITTAISTNIMNNGQLRTMIKQYGGS